MASLFTLFFRRLFFSRIAFCSRTVDITVAVYTSIRVFKLISFINVGGCRCSNWQHFLKSNDFCFKCNSPFFI